MLNLAVDRRALIGGGLSLGAALFLPRPALAALPERRLCIRNLHTGETADACYWSAGKPRADGLAELNHVLRDWRTNESTRMDDRLLDLLVELRGHISDSPRTAFSLISGYRSPKTNAALHQRSHAVATKSQHMLGKAVDIRMAGVDLDRLHKAALALKGGGVGYYPRDNFVHVDTGRVRRW